MIYLRYKTRLKSSSTLDILHAHAKYNYLMKKLVSTTYLIFTNSKINTCYLVLPYLPLSTSLIIHLQRLCWNMMPDCNEFHLSYPTTDT